MCGINGFSWPDENLVRKMNLVVKNRGPDAEGVYVDAEVSLGHRRLSIIDLSEKGKQPMCNEDGTVWLTYNGEVYNFSEIKSDLVSKGHVFTSSTDSEVVIHAYEEYGIECSRKFNGMWAFCIYDSRRKRLVLSGDHFGIKPLFYHCADGHFVFSSMISGILCHDVRTAPNERAILEYLAFNLQQHDEYTFFEGISSLSPGTTLVYDLETKQLTKNRYYTMEAKGPQDTQSIKDLFVESVRLRTIADVPIGSCLSGGLDSSAIVGVLNRQLKTRFNTFSLVVPGKSFDESRYINEVGRHADVNQYFTTVDAGRFLNDIPDFVECHEEPVRGVSPYAQYCLMKLAHEKGMKVLLDGQGGDEIFGGYKYYFSYYFYELMRQWRFLRLCREIVSSRNSYSVAMLGFQLMPGWVKYALWERFINTWMGRENVGEVRRMGDPRWRAMPLADALRLTIQTTSLPQLLALEDRNSMRWSVESRVPFLDFNLVEAAMGCTSSQKLQGHRTKAIFRDAVEGFVPPLILDRRDKIGFQAPSDELFRDKGVADYAKSIVYSESFKRRHYWNWPRVKDIFDAHLSGKANAGDTIWKWLNTELWLRRHFD